MVPNSRLPYHNGSFRLRWSATASSVRCTANSTRDRASMNSSASQPDPPVGTSLPAQPTMRAPTGLRASSVR